MLDPGCDFCAEFNGLPDHLYSELVGRGGPARVVLTEGNLVAVPSLGEILPYHLLIIPTYHITSILNLLPNDRASFARLVRHICRAFKAAFGEKPVLFEHGDPKGTDVFNGQCVSHAHFHVLPRHVDLLSIVRSERPLLTSVALDDIGAVTDESYVAVMDDDEVLHLFSSKDAPRQYLRALYGKLVGVADAEWWRARSSGATTAASTEKLRTLFRGHND
jgi:diadenosine tetraphosphate (Ap4A) HIT family hydrolase